MPAPQKILEQFLALVESQKQIPQELKNELVKSPTIDDMSGQLIRAQILTESEALTYKGKAFGLPTKELREGDVPAHILNTIPQELSETYHIIAFSQVDGILSVGIVDPTNLKAQEAVQFIARKLGLKVQFFVITKNTWEAIAKEYAALKAEVQEALDIAQTSFQPDEGQGGIDTETEIGDVIKSAPISKMVSVVLKHAVEQKASDVHIEPTMSGSRVRYRIDGVLKTLLELPQYVHPAIVSRIKVMAHLKIDETRRPQDGRVRLKFGEKMIDFRVSILPLHEREKVVLRILDTGSKVISLEDLGFWGRNLKVMRENISKPHGLLLVTGPTGSGKSTTLYAVLNILNQEAVNITTLEDPVEYYLQGVNQSQIRPDVGLTFAAGLRSILRQDPDIVMVGEIRDNETAELAIHASLTGHVVLSTLHTNDALGAIPRLADMKVEPFLLSSTINAVVAQRLVRKICSHCKQSKPIPLDVAQGIFDKLNAIPGEDIPEGFTIGDAEHMTMFYGKGCPECNDTGYSGRSSVSEVLAVDDNFKAIIAKGVDPNRMKEEWDRQKTLTMEQDGLIKVMQGITTLEEIMRVTQE